MTSLKKIIKCKFIWGCVCGFVFAVLFISIYVCSYLKFEKHNTVHIKKFMPFAKRIVFENEHIEISVSNFQYHAEDDLGINLVKKKISPHDYIYGLTEADKFTLFYADGERVERSEKK